MIQSFRCKQTRSLFEGNDPPRFRAFKETAIRKLTQLEAAQTLEFLRSPLLQSTRGFERRSQRSIQYSY